jgi:hypothetical protein
MSITTKTMGALFAALAIILAVSPRYIYNIYSTILGRILLIGIVVFFSMNNITLGLLAALAIIAASNQFGSFSQGSIFEGMENGTTIGEDNVAQKGTQPVLTDEAVKKVTDTITQKISELKDKDKDVPGVDIESIKTAIMSKESKSIPIDLNAMKSDEVSASASGMLKSSSLEGFKAYSYI